MRILLIRPPFMDVKTGPPIGLAYIQGALKKAGHRVTVWDMNGDVDRVRDEDIDRDFKVPDTHPAVQEAYKRLDEFCDRALNQDPDVVGFSLAHNTVDYGLAMAKCLMPHVRCIAGGPQASFNEKALLEEGCFAAVVSGYGEEAVFSALHEDGIFSQNLKRDIDYRPDYTGFSLADYHGFFPIVTTRGCPNHCLFCTQHFLYYYHPIASVIDQLEDTSQIRQIHYNDSNINVNTERTVKLFEAVRRLGPMPHSIVFGFQIRAEYQHYIAPMAEAGVREVFIGMESGSSRERASMAKPAWDNDMAVAVIKELTDHQILTWAQFIFGYPDQTAKDRKKTLALMNRINGECDPTYVRFQWFRFVVHLGLEESFRKKYGVEATSPKNWCNALYTPQKLDQLGREYKKLVPDNSQLYL